jgi:hypothetical protein
MREIHPIRGACVSHGREMASSSRWRRRLGDAQLAEIDRAVRQASARGLGCPPPRPLAVTTAARQPGFFRRKSSGLVTWPIVWIATRV